MLKWQDNRGYTLLTNKRSKLWDFGKNYLKTTMTSTKNQ